MKRTLLLLSACAGVLGMQAQSTCLTAVPVGLGSTAVAGITGSQVPSPICTINGGGATMGMWYTYISAVDTGLNISTVASLVDTRFHVYTGTCDALACVGGDDDSGPSYSSVTTINVEAGVIYTIAFDNRWSSAGFNFILTETNGIPPPPPPPEGMVAFVGQGLPGVVGSTYGVVDMDADHLDDVVSVSTTNINVVQQVAGGFVPHNYTTTAADFVASWSMAAGDIDGNGFNDLEYGGGGW